MRSWTGLPIRNVLPLVLAVSACFVEGVVRDHAGTEHVQGETPPPFFEIAASSLYDAGLQQGRLASSRIRAWLASPEMKRVIAFTRSTGRQVFQELRQANARVYSQYAEEIRGIAEGAAVDLDEVWAANLVFELEGFMRTNVTGRSAGHCSDIFAISPTGYANGFSHGHNEDWEGIVKDLFYFVKITASNGANFSSCAGLAYPGTIVGWAATWNAHGMYLTQNSLYPRSSRPNGSASLFAQREAMCGLTGGNTMEAVTASVTSLPWSYGASVNLIDVRARRMANIEFAQDKHHYLEVTEAMGNYSHFNMYKRLRPGRPGDAEASTVHRQARVDALPAPRQRGDIMAILSDQQDRDYPVYKDDTLATLVLDGLTGRLDVWCGPAAVKASALYSWNLLTFFQSGIVYA